MLHLSAVVITVLASALLLAVVIGLIHCWLDVLCPLLLQVLSLVERSHRVLDKTHLALCMKRLFTLSTKQQQLCDTDIIRQDHRFQVSVCLSCL